MVTQATQTRAADCGKSGLKYPLDRVRTASASLSCMAFEIRRLDVDDAGEPRVLEGTAVVVGRDAQVPQ